MAEGTSKTKLPKGEEHTLKNITFSPSTKQMPQGLGKQKLPRRKYKKEAQIIAEWLMGDRFQEMQKPVLRRRIYSEVYSNGSKYRGRRVRSCEQG